MDNKNKADMKNIISEVIAMTQSIVDYSGEADEQFLQLLEERNQQFIKLQELMEQPEAIQEYRELLNQLLQLHQQATEVIERYKTDAANNINKIEKGKQTASLYEHGKNRSGNIGRSVIGRSPYQATPDAAFFDTKK
jgi:hypothetical protein